MINGLAAFLRERKDSIVRIQKISAQTPGMTEGYMDWETIAEVETIDFDALMNEIAEFEASFRSI